MVVITASGFHRLDRFGRVFVSFLLLALSACALNSGAAEFIAYRQAFDESRTSSEALFDLLENAERKQQRIVADRTLGGEFDPNSAFLYTDLSDPPLTNEYKLSFDTISRYNQLMVALVTGERAQLLNDDLELLATSIVSLPASVTGSSKLAAAQTFVPILGTISEFAIGFQNRRIFAEELAVESEAVITLMLEMRNGAGTIFKFIRASSSKSQSDVEKLVADWVVLMDRNISALRLAQSAARNPQFGAADVKALQERVQEIREAAEGVREGLAQL
ncbi:hypothetical protein ACUXV3_03880 [Roseobacteraceae bacterium NS-SX3]